MGSLFLFYLVSVVHWFHSSALSGENEDVGRLNPLDPSYIILAPRVIRPGMVYRLSATLLKNEPLQIRASLLRDGVSLDSTHRDCQVGVSELLLMKVPASITGGHFVLRVEGSINGGLGGVAFTNETALMFSNRSLTVFVQMERPVYKQGQTVRFRAIPISTALKPFDDAIDVFMLDPRGQIMKQWLSRQSNYGAVSLSYEIGDQPMFGQWTIRITARGQTTDQAFVIEEYFRTVFELNVTLPALVTHADQYLRGTVTANHTDGAPVRGNLTLKATLRNPSGEVQETLLQFRDMEQYTGLYFLSFLETRDTSLFPFFSGVYSFSYPIDDLLYLMPDMNFIQITATVGDSFWGHVVEARSACKFFNGSLYLRFLNPSPSVFAPEFPITAYISISYYDGSRLPSHALRAHRLRITPRVRLQNGRDELLESRELISISPGLWELQLDFKEELSLRGLSPMNVTCANVDAGYITQYETTAAWATLALVPEYAPAGRHIQLRTSSVRPKVGEYLILHVRTNYYLDSFNYLIISKGVVLSQGKEYMKNMIHSFAFSLGPEMAPELTVLLYHISALGDLVVASLAVPIDGLSKDEFSVQVNVQKDKVLDGVEIIVRGRPGSYVGLSAARSSLTSLLNTMSKAEVTRRLSSFDTVPLVLHQNWLNKEGVVEESLRFPWTTYQRDANKSIQAVGLVVLTDARIQMESRRQCSDSLRSAAPCFGGKGPGKCGRRSLCHTDKKPCELESNNVSPLLDSPEFPVDRFSRASETWFEGSWLWQDLNIGPHGHSIFSISLPKTPTSWAITAISVAEDTGLALLSGPLIFEGVRPFHMKMEAPSVCHQGEQVGLRITLFNAMERDIQATVVLLDSQRHRFVHVEAGGVGVMEAAGQSNPTDMAEGVDVKSNLETSFLTETQYGGMELEWYQTDYGIDFSSLEDYPEDALGKMEVMSKRSCTDLLNETSSENDIRAGFDRGGMAANKEEEESNASSPASNEAVVVDSNFSSVLPSWLLFLEGSLRRYPLEYQQRTRDRMELQGRLKTLEESRCVQERSKMCLVRRIQWLEDSVRKLALRNAHIQGARTYVVDSWAKSLPETSFDDGLSGFNFTKNLLSNHAQQMAMCRNILDGNSIHEAPKFDEVIPYLEKEYFLQQVAMDPSDAKLLRRESVGQDVFSASSHSSQLQTCPLGAKDAEEWETCKDSNLWGVPLTSDMEPYMMKWESCHAVGAWIVSVRCQAAEDLNGRNVASYNPRTSNGNHEHLVWIKKQGVEVVYMPIVPQGLGQVFVTVVGKDEVTKVINVLPDGVPQFRHTPVLVDLSNRAYSLQFIKVNVSSSPIVPYQQHRLYVFGSNEAVLSLVGDVVGETLMRNDSDLPSRLAEGGSEQTLFRFAHTLYSIVYLHSTNQDRADVLRLAFHQLNLYYQKQLSFQMENGAFCAYRWRCESDLWLTAFTIQVFQESILGEWENYFFVDISVCAFD
ncbi:unnamed protein product [Cyprideis torosa]|uniref:Uncharacterized protein n=1 Tax=Cyprideis torosa TaxID=163714 RepID=A0A7R8WD31_9CRUS|nr:unnamed protein product [Cyprideis torosa]CAG0894125.1 unnamed protein product [Cyprideis torosa]